MVRHDPQGACIILPRLLIPAELVQRRALRREQPPVRIIRAVGAAKHLESLLEIAVIGQRTAIGGEQQLVAGMSDGALFEHRNRLRPLSGGTQRLAVSQRDVGILRIGAIAFLIGFGVAARIAGGIDIGLLAD